MTSLYKYSFIWLLYQPMYSYLRSAHKAALGNFSLTKVLPRKTTPKVEQIKNRSKMEW